MAALRGIGDLSGSKEIRPTHVVSAALLLILGPLVGAPTLLVAQATEPTSVPAHPAEGPAILDGSPTAGSTLRPAWDRLIPIAATLESGIPSLATDGWFRTQVEPEGMAGWKKGLLWGGLVGAGAGILAYLFVDAIPCDTCSGTGADSSADGTFLEFTLGFGAIGAGIGALIGGL